MVTFALVTEGITDQAVIESILGGLYDDDLEVNPLQPLRDETDRTRKGEYGGFEQVIEYCGTREIVDALQYNDFVIVQIDTDRCDHPSIAIQPTAGGQDKTPERLIDEMRTYLQSKIGAADFSRFIFAIAVHSTECWLLVSYAKNAKEGKAVTNCEDRLRRALAAKDIALDKNHGTYRQLSRDLRKAKHLTTARESNTSLDIFVSTLPRPTSTAAPDQ